MNKAQMVISMVSHYSRGSQVDFAELIGVSPQTVSAWITRGTFNAELLYGKLENISADWLLSGEGGMIKTDNQIVYSQNVDYVELKNLCKILIENFKQRDSIITDLVSLMKKFN